MKLSFAKAENSNGSFLCTISVYEKNIKGYNKIN